MQNGCPSGSACTLRGSSTESERSKSSWPPSSRTREFTLSNSPGRYWRRAEMRFEGATENYLRTARA